MNVKPTLKRTQENEKFCSLERHLSKKQFIVVFVMLSVINQKLHHSNC